MASLVGTKTGNDTDYYLESIAVKTVTRRLMELVHGMLV
jgi:hypothetical protein